MNMNNNHDFTNIENNAQKIIKYILKQTDNLKHDITTDKMVNFTPKFLKQKHKMRNK